MKIDIFNTNKKYNIIYADPAWTFKCYSSKGEKKSAQNHYPCMKIEDIYNLPVGDLADENCVLFLWVTFPLLQEGIETIKRWGFKYKGCAFTWVKQNPKGEGIYSGLGHWTNGNAELCLFAKKGKPHRVEKNVKQIILSPRQRHSQKPSETRNRIVRLIGDLPRIELFARQYADGWDCWGNEV